jgi:hypothetical protein
MAGGVSFGPGEGQQPGHSLDTALRDLSLELDKLISELEAEIRVTGQVSEHSAERLRQLRVQFQRTFSRNS